MPTPPDLRVDDAVVDLTDTGGGMGADATDPSDGLPDQASTGWAEDSHAAEPPDASPGGSLLDHFPSWRPSRTQVRVAVLLCGWVSVMFATCWLLGSDRVPAGATVAGVDIGGLDGDQAIDALNQTIGPESGRTMRVRVFGRDTKLAAADAGITIDAASTVGAVISSRWSPMDLWTSWFGGSEHKPVLLIDEATAAATFGHITADGGNQMREPAIDYQGLQPVARPGRTGQQIDTQAAIGAIAAAFPGNGRAGGRAISLPTTARKPTVSDEIATQMVAGTATHAVTGPITLTVDTRSVQVDPTALARTLRFEVADGKLQPRVDAAALHRELASSLATLETPVIEAGWDTSGSTPTLIESRDGQGIKNDALAAAILQTIDKSGAERSAALDLVPLHPKRTTTEARGLGITEQLSTFTQEFPYAAYRVQNIGLAAKKVDGTVLPPGATFSLNDTVGERTAAAGFTTGYVVGEGGRLQEDLGGGVSTAATALWSAAFYAGLERVQQSAHLIWISRYRPGLEATVYWKQLDLKFRNDTGNGVLITTKMTNTSITVNVWGKKQYDAIVAVSGPRETVRPFASVEDNSDGCVQQQGVEGFDIAVERIFKRGGEEVKRQKFTTHYIPATAVKCTGKAAAPPK